MGEGQTCFFQEIRYCFRTCTAGLGLVEQSAWWCRDAVFMRVSSAHVLQYMGACDVLCAEQAGSCVGVYSCSLLRLFCSNFCLTMFIARWVVLCVIIVCIWYWMRARFVSFSKTSFAVNRTGNWKNNWKTSETFVCCIFLCCWWPVFRSKVSHDRSYIRWMLAGSIIVINTV